MVKQHYLVCSIDSFRTPALEPKPIKCLRFIRDKDEEHGELYEYASHKKTLLLFHVRVEKTGELLVIKVLPQMGDKYVLLRMILVRNKIRGKYIKDKTMPFAFVLKEIDEINI